MVPEEARVAAGLSLQTRRALLENVASAYREAPPAKKRVLLDEFTQTTGYHRTYARWLLKHSEEVLQTVIRHPRQSRFGRARAGMERKQSQVYQMPDSLPAHPARCVGAPWVSPSDISLHGQREDTLFLPHCPDIHLEIH